MGNWVTFGTPCKVATGIHFVVLKCVNNDRFCILSRLCHPFKAVSPQYENLVILSTYNFLG